MKTYEGFDFSVDWEKGFLSAFCAAYLWFNCLPLSLFCQDYLARIYLHLH